MTHEKFNGLLTLIVQVTRFDGDSGIPAKWLKPMFP